MDKGPMAMAINKATVGNAISDAERQVVLRANAMLTLADFVEGERLAGARSIALTRKEMDLIAYALRMAADNDDN